MRRAAPQPVQEVTQGAAKRCLLRLNTSATDHLTLEEAWVFIQKSITLRAMISREMLQDMFDRAASHKCGKEMDLRDLQRAGSQRFRISHLHFDHWIAIIKEANPPNSQILVSQTGPTKDSLNVTKSGSGTGYIILSKQEKEEALLKCPDLSEERRLKAGDSLMSHMKSSKRSASTSPPKVFIGAKQRLEAKAKREEEAMQAWKREQAANSTLSHPHPFITKLKLPSNQEFKQDKSLYLPMDRMEQLYAEGAKVPPSRSGRKDFITKFHLPANHDMYLEYMEEKRKDDIINQQGWEEAARVPKPPSPPAFDATFELRSKKQEFATGKFFPEAPYKRHEEANPYEPQIMQRKAEHLGMKAFVPPPDVSASILATYVQHPYPWRGPLDLRKLPPSSS
jgi:hypothetical protein|uniref:Uncharacterized protein n=1 Tax=Eutreptiella gymnastica TaxID=73025 RepID=A0A7S4G4C0_9EUGL